MEQTHDFALRTFLGKAAHAPVARDQDNLPLENSPADGTARNGMADPLTQARALLAEQSQNFDAMRGTIVQIGQSLNRLSDMAPDGRTQPSHLTSLLSAQAEAIQGLTVLVLKGQQVQAELLNAVDGQARPVAAAPELPRWIYVALGATALWSVLAPLAFRLL